MQQLLKRLVLEEDGQGLVEYTLIVVLVALVFWVAIKSTNIRQSIGQWLEQGYFLRWRSFSLRFFFVKPRLAWMPEAITRFWYPSCRFEPNLVFCLIAYSA